MQVLATQLLEAHHELWMQLAPVERVAGRHETLVKFLVRAVMAIRMIQVLI